MTLTEAKKKVMDLVAVRDHSQAELRQKLARHFELSIIDEAVTWAEQQSWFKAADNLKTDVAQKLNSRGQGITKVNAKLAAMGLDEVKPNTVEEYEKARRAAYKKFGPDAFAELTSAEVHQLKTKVVRFLSGRGFEEEIVNQILMNEFKAGAFSHDEEY